MKTSTSPPVVPGVTLSGDSLGTWKESPLNLRSGANDPINTKAVTLGWNSHIRGDDTTKLGQPATYTIALSDSLRSALHVGRESAIYLSLAPTDAKPGPRSPPRDTTKKADSTKKDDKKPPPKKPDAEESAEGHDAGRSHGRDGRRGGTRRALAAQQVRRAAPSARDPHPPACATRSSSASRRSTRWCCRPT